MKHCRSLLHLILATVLLLAACTPATAPAHGDAVVVAAPAGAMADALEAAAEAYRAAGGTEVRVSTFPANSYANTIQAALLAGLSDYDLVDLSAESLARWQKANAIRPIPNLNGENLAPWLPAVTVSGEPLGLPTQPDPLVLWYRTDRLPEDQLPQSWQALSETAQAINHPSAKRYGLAFSNAGLDGARTYIALLAGFGGQAIVDVEGSGPHTSLDSAPTREALNWLVGLRDLVQPLDPDETGVSFSGVTQALREGQADMGLAPLSARDTLLDCEQPAPTCADGQPLLQWTWLPGSGGKQMTGDLHALAVPFNARKPEPAQRFIAWLAGAEGARVLVENDILPAHRGILAESVDQRLQAMERVDLYLPPVAVNEPVWEPLIDAVTQAERGEKPPETALAEASQSLDKILRRARP